MHMLSKDDRTKANALHGLSERETVPLNHRDASGSSLWKGLPTPINLPRNLPRPNLDARVRRNDPSPWSSMGTPPQNRPGNQTAQRTLTRSGPPPRKKMKISPLSPTSKLPWVAGKGISRTPQTPSYGPEVITIDDNDEDMGTVINANISDEPPSGRMLSKRKPSPPKFQTHQVEDDIISSSGAASGSRSHVVRDGAATVALQKSMGDLHEDSDPIADFPSTSPPPSRKNTAQVNVKAIVQKLENAKHTPHLNLRDFDMSGTRRKGIKNNMKGKNPASDEPRDPIATKPTAFTSSEIVDRHPGAIKKQLWIKEWFYGTEHRHGGCFVTWEGAEKFSILEEGKTQPVLYLKLKGEVSSVEFSKIGDDVAVISLSTIKPLKGRHNGRNTPRFKMGDKQSGTVTIKFDDTHEDWSTLIYDAFIAWVSKVVNSKSVLVSSAARRMWEWRERQSELGDVLANRQQEQGAKSGDTSRRPPKRSAPDDADSEYDELMLPPVAELSGEVTNSRDASSSSSDSRITNDHSPVLVQVPRRSARRLSPRRSRSPTLDPDEVILCYPQGMPGAVNINNADLKRLQPGEFLNDTLIEFGLKSWLRRLEESDPELASQVHVFSSFFYKKLNKKNMDEGYESVRKWTAKINLFSKKYIIVPINENLHWYLVIIYQPEHVLIPPTILASPTTRGRKSMISTPLPVPERHSSVSMKPLSTTSNPPSKPSSTTDQISSREKPSSAKPTSSLETHTSTKPYPTGPSSKQTSVSPEETDNFSTTREVEVEAEMMKMGLLDFNPSVSVTITSLDSSRAMDQDTLSPDHVEDAVPETPCSDLAMDVVEDLQPQRRSAPVSDFENSSAGFHTRHDVHDVDMDNPPLASTSRLDAQSLFDDKEDTQHPSTVSPMKFYQKSQKAQGKQKAISNQAVLLKNDYPVMIDGAEPEKEPLPSSPVSEKTTYIFTFDSLGSRHPQAIKQLSRYLRKEAEDKMNLKMADTSDAVGKQALVPVQPNYSDCGLYLLHFAKTFMSDPLKYCQIIKARPKGTMNVDRQDDWKADLTGNMRERLADEIKQLSVEWKQERAAKEEAKRKETTESSGPIEVVESSDDEVDIVETMPAVTATAKKGAKGKAPVRGNAMRVR